MVSSIDRVAAFLRGHDLLSREAAEVRPGTRKAGSDRPWIWGTFASVVPADVQLIANLYERWSQGDYKTGEFFDPEIDYARIGATVPGDAGQWHGLDEMWRAAVAYMRGWEDLRNEAERIIDLGDRIVVLDRQTGTGRASGIVMQHLVTQVFTVSDGKIVHWDSYWDRDEASRAAGIDPALLSA